MTRYTWVVGSDSGIGATVAGWLSRLPLDERKVMATGKIDADVRDPDGMERTVDAFLGTVEFDAKIDIVYCAGVTELQDIGKLDMETVEDIFQVNVLGFIRLVDILRNRNVEDVRMVVITSDAAKRPMRTSLAYCASKAALEMAVRCAARELANVGWRVNGIAPGMTAHTGMADYIDATVPVLRGWTEEEAAAYELQQAVIKRRASTTEIAQMVEMVLNAPDYYNGDILTINGGR